VMDVAIKQRDIPSSKICRQVIPRHNLPELGSKCKFNYITGL
ncbi:hypothetical protein A2U01_0062572, partial [Trifolium medium]|nr:hypothetical protein [Trifolium medium]